MYGIYNAETLEQFINMVHHIHNTKSSNEKLLIGLEGSLKLQSLYANAQGMQHFSMNSLLYLRNVKDKYILLYKELITKLCIYAAAITILSKRISAHLPHPSIKIKGNPEWG